MARKKKENKKLAQLLNLPKILAEGITTEKLDAIYLDLSALKHQPEPLYRLDIKGHRLYYRFVDEMPIFYTSVTTLIKNTLPTPSALIKWLTEQDNGEAEAMERASYGTFLHSACQTLLIQGFYDLDALESTLKEFLVGEQLPPNRIKWTQELKKDLCAFAQFVIDKQVKPLAIEIILFHPDDGYAGAIDLVCEMNFSKKRIVAIVDIKSGRKGFYESHEIQLKAYQTMWQLHFPDIRVEKVFNFSPKSWVKAPTYNLKDQTEAKSAEKLPHLVALAKIEESRRDNMIISIEGKLELAKGLAQNISEKLLTDLVKENKL